MESKEIEIDISDIIYNLACKWRRILAWMIVFAVLLNGVSILKNVKSSRQSMKDPDVQLQQQITTCKAIISIREAEETEQSFATYLEVYNAIEKERAYCDRSLVMSLDAMSVPTYSMQYMIGADATMESVNSIIAIYQKQLVDESIIAQIQELVGSEYDYPEELISVTNVVDNSTLIMSEEAMHSGVLDISIAADTKENCEKIAQIVEKRADDLTVELRTKLGNYQFGKVSEAYMLTSNRNISDAQTREYNTLSTLRYTINNIKNALSENQKKYFDLLWEVEKIRAEQNSADAEATTAAAGTNAGGYISVKFTVVGAFLGLFLSIIYYIFQYLLSRKLRIEDEICEKYSIPLLGETVINTEKKMNGIDKAIQNRFKRTGEKGTMDQQYERIVQEMKMRAKDGESILLTGTFDTEETRNLKAQLKRRCEGESYELMIAESLVDSTEALSLLDKAHSVIVVEQTGRSQNKKIYKELELCKRYEVPIMGAIIIQS